MSTGSTGKYSLPYPLSTDQVNVSGDIKKLAEKIDNDLQEIIEDTSADMWTGGTFSNGLNTPTYNDTTGKISMSLSQNLQTSASPIFVNLTLTGDAAINGGDITTSQTIFNLVNTNATTLNIGGSGTTVNIGNASGQTNFAGDVNVATGKSYYVNNVSVLSNTTLGSSVVNSSLTSVGTITTGIWNATTISVDKGGTGIISYAVGDIVYASASATLSKLSGVSTGNALLSGGIGVAPLWGKVGLTTHVSGTLPVANGGTGITYFGSGVATWLGSPSSENLAAAITDETGTGSLVFASGPSLSGVPTSPTASVDTNTTQIATTEYVVGQGYLKSSTASATYSPIASPTFTGTLSSAGTEILMRSSASGSPTENVFFTVNRGDESNVSIRWNETGDTWQFTNDGLNYLDFGSGGGSGSADEIIGITFFTMGA
jgi:hypothetical protein